MKVIVVSRNGQEVVKGRELRERMAEDNVKMERSTEGEGKDEKWVRPTNILAGGPEKSSPLSSSSLRNPPKNSELSVLLSRANWWAEESKPPSPHRPQFPSQSHSWLFRDPQIPHKLNLPEKHKTQVGFLCWSSEMANCLEELDNAIAKLHQNFQELRYHLEKSFLEQGRALLKFEAQWKDLKKDHSRENEQRQVHLQQMGFSIPSNGTEHYAAANPNAASWSNTSARPAGNATPRPSGNGTPKLHCEVCNIYCDTKDVLNKHKQGKKHKMNLDKLKGKKIPGENSKRRAADQPPEDLETKRRKVLESGAAPDALRTCALCNVVCLTETDFNNHRSGQRHVEAATAARRHGAGTSGASSHWQSQWRYQGWNS